MIDSALAVLNVTAFWIGWVSQVLVLMFIPVLLWNWSVVWFTEPGERSIHTVCDFGRAWFNTLHPDQQRTEALVKMFRYPYYIEGGILKVLVLPRWVVHLLQRMGKIEPYETAEQIHARRQKEADDLWGSDTDDQKPRS